MALALALALALETYLPPLPTLSLNHGSRVVVAFRCCCSCRCCSRYLLLATVVVAVCVRSVLFRPPQAHLKIGLQRLLVRLCLYVIDVLLCSQQRQQLTK